MKSLSMMDRNQLLSCAALAAALAGFSSQVYADPTYGIINQQPVGISTTGTPVGLSTNGVPVGISSTGIPVGASYGRLQVMAPYRSTNYYRQAPAWYRGYSGYPREVGNQYPQEMLPNTSATFVAPDGRGGYELGSYSTDSCGDAIPSVYALYDGVPGYILVDNGYVQNILPVSGVSIDDCTSQESEPSQVNEYNYTVNNYYSAPPPADTQSAASDETSPMKQQAVAPGYDQAFADIQQAWLTGDSALLSKHLPAAGGQVSVMIAGKSSYVMESNHFAQITQDAFNNLNTYAFVLSRVKKNADGSVKGYVTHTYAPVTASDSTRDTMYLSFTLSDASGTWLITGVDSSATPLDEVDSTAGTSAKSAVVYTNK